VRIDGSIRRAHAAFDADRLRWLDEAAALAPIAGLRFGPATTWVLSDSGADRTMTTATALSWALVHGASNAGEWARLRTEPDRARLFIDDTADHPGRVGLHPHTHTSWYQAPVR
jgi:hypothetical protein